MPSYPGMLGPAYQSQSYLADSEICMNWFLEKNESPNAPTPYVMLPTPGMASVFSFSQAPIRAEFATQSRPFAVAGFAFHEAMYNAVTGAWTTTQRGTVTADSHPATISANAKPGNQLFITSGGLGYCFNLGTNTLSTVGVGGTTVTMGASVATRFLYLDANTGTLYWSGIYDGTAWSALQSAQTTAGDPWVSMCVTPDGLIHLFGETTREAWQNVDSPQIFAPIQEAFQPEGIAAPYGFAVDTAVTWLGQSTNGRGIVYRMQGYGAQRVSTHAIEAAIQSYGTISDATAFAYQQDGHAFFVLTFPTENKTWVFDEMTGLWHERGYWDTRTGSFLAYRPGTAMSVLGFTLVGDRMTGTVYKLSKDLYTDVDGAYIRHVRQPPRLAFDQKRFTTHNLQVVLDVGQGLVTGQGSDPQLMLQSSRNSGKTFGAERWKSIGPIGNWDTRVRWNMLGQARNRVDRLIATDPVPYRIVDCVIDVAVGTS